jgi:predicted acetyltransferase
MREIRKLTAVELSTFAAITANAYPGLKIITAEDAEKSRQRMEMMTQDPALTFYGLFEADEMLGGMRLHDFTMQLFATQTLVGGLGGVAVDLRRKKEKVARDIVLFFLRHYRQSGACLTALYPFRPDFYKQMGFGYGTKMNKYVIEPASLPRSATRPTFHYLTGNDREEVVACFTRMMAQTHGYFNLPPYVSYGMFMDPALKVVGVGENGRLHGYLSFKFDPFQKGSFLNTNLIIQHFVYDSPAAFHQLLTFLRLQADQISRIIWHTQDDALHFLLQDPRNDSGHLMPNAYHESNSQGVGLMYRVIDVPRLFAVLQNHNFGGQTCRLDLALTDTFLPENEGHTQLEFNAGRITLLAEGSESPPDVTLALDVADFSALIVGAVTLHDLHRYGLATLSDERWLDTLHHLFRTDKKPQCVTAF